MQNIKYIDRKSGKEALEEVYGGKALQFLYGESLCSRLLGYPLSHLLAKCPWISSVYGWWQKQPHSKKKIAPFLSRFNINTSDFLDSADQYASFNDFFIRKLKKSARPISPGNLTAIIPADGRYRFFPDISKADGFVVKNKKFLLSELLGSEDLAKKYAQGSMVMARLCPTDYHRFHFPCDNIPSEPHLINGYLYSVNPIALAKNISIFVQNKRFLTVLKTEFFGEVLYLEIGATNVGSIHETFTPHSLVNKGEEKGYFSFGGSALILLFPPATLEFDADLLELSKSGLEIYCQMGQSMGSLSLTQLREKAQKLDIQPNEGHH